MYAAMLRAKAEAVAPGRIMVFNPVFYKILSRERGSQRTVGWSKEVRVSACEMQLADLYLQVDIFSLDMLLFPVLLPEAEHWLCVAINFKVKRIEIYDSMHADRPEVLEVGSINWARRCKHC